MTSTVRTLNYQFDASQYNPESQFDAIPGGNYLLAITNTEIRNVGKQGEQKGDCFSVEFTVVDGEMKGRKVWNNYNLWYRDDANDAAKVAMTCRIAHEQLSALSHVVGVYKLDMNNVGADLRGKQLRADVALRDNKYNDIKQVYDISGNKPKRAGSGAPAASPVAVAAPGAPAQYAPQGGFQQPTAPQPIQSGFVAPGAPPAPAQQYEQQPAVHTAAPAPAQPQPAAMPQAGGWQPPQQAAPVAAPGAPAGQMPAAAPWGAPAA